MGLETILIILLILFVISMLAGMLPMDERAKQIFWVVVAVVIILWLLGRI